MLREELIESSIDSFFSRWIVNTPLANKADVLSEAIKTIPLTRKDMVIDSALVWVNEPCGASACCMLHYFWQALIFLKYHNYLRMYHHTKYTSLQNDISSYVDFFSYGDIMSKMASMHPKTVLQFIEVVSKL